MKRMKGDEAAEDARVEPAMAAQEIDPLQMEGTIDAPSEDRAIDGAAGDAVVPLDDATVEPEPESEPRDVDQAIADAFATELAEARRLADHHWELYLRAEADLDNLRKRAERLREEALARQRRELLLRFLEVADNLERALAFGDADPAALVGGVETTYRELGRLLAREGVEPLAAMDAPFDPAFHEAVSVVTLPDLAEERVVAVEQPGYTLGAELLRPARVVVGRPPALEGDMSVGAPTDDPDEAPDKG